MPALNILALMGGNSAAANAVVATSSAPNAVAGEGGAFAPVLEGALRSPANVNTPATGAAQSGLINALLQQLSGAALTAQGGASGQGDALSSLLSAQNPDALTQVEALVGTMVNLLQEEGQFAPETLARLQQPEVTDQIAAILQLPVQDVQQALKKIIAQMQMQNAVAAARNEAEAVIEKSHEELIKDSSTKEDAAPEEEIAESISSDMSGAANAVPPLPVAIVLPAPIEGSPVMAGGSNTPTVAQGGVTAAIPASLAEQSAVQANNAVTAAEIEGVASATPTPTPTPTSTSTPISTPAKFVSGTEEPVTLTSEEVPMVANIGTSSATPGASSTASAKNTSGIAFAELKSHASFAPADAETGAGGGDNTLSSGLLTGESAVSVTSEAAGGEGFTAADGIQLQDIAGGAAPLRAAESRASAAFARQEVAMASVPVTEQVLVRIRDLDPDKTKEIEIQMDPVDLGKVHVRMEVGNDGRTQVTLTADKRETLDLLQRDRLSLEKALSDLGLKTDSGGMSFNLREQPRGQQEAMGDGSGQQRGQNWANPDALPEELREETPPNQPYRGYRLNLDEGVNIRV